MNLRYGRDAGFPVRNLAASSGERLRLSVRLAPPLDKIAVAAAPADGNYLNMRPST